MEPRTLLNFMGVAERLKCNMRHSRTTNERRESVAEHTYRLCVFAWLVKEELKEEFPECDMDKVITMCLFHDLGEAVTGDIPAFVKTDDDRKTEGNAISQVTAMLPEKEQKELDGLFEELEAAETTEAKIVHALDKMEALIQHNEADIETWLPLEYKLQMTYGQKESECSDYLKNLRKVIEQDSKDKIEQAKREQEKSGKEGERDKSYYIRKGIENMNQSDVVKLLHSTDWAKERPESKIITSMEHSCPYGLFLKTDTRDTQIGFARVLTDHTTTFYLMDVVIAGAHRNQGYGTKLMNKIMEDTGHLYGILHTTTASDFYKKYGFQEAENLKTQEYTEEIRMEKPPISH